MLIFALACIAPPQAEAARKGLGWVDSIAEQAPMSLTAADGSGLRLVELDVQAVIEGPLAFTELHLVFENPSDRQIEGRFEITLPTGAAVSRFAMKLGEQWQEGEVVELKAARRAYEDFLHRRTDPALLEYDAGNEFRARVFPIEAKGTKELIISWSHDLDAGEPWSLPTGGLPELGVLNARITSAGKTYTMNTEYAVPEGDLSLAIPVVQTVALRGANTSVVRIQPDLKVEVDPVKNATVLVDTSASRALSWDALLRDLQAIVPSFSGSVRVLAYDQEVVEIWSGKASGFGAEAIQALEQRGPLGASNLEGALAEVKTERVVLFTDGVVTAGERESSELRALLAKSGIQRLDAVVRGGARDEAALAQWVSALPHDGVVLDADALPHDELVERLGLGTAGSIEISVPGAEWIWPDVVSGLQPGDSLTVYADLPRSAPLNLQLDGRSAGKITSRSSDGPLLVRASAQAEIQALQYRSQRAQSAEEREAFAARIVEVSTKNRVLSPHTALLVLETEADYERFGIPRNALSDILIVDRDQLGWLKRGTPVYGGAAIEEPPDNVGRDVTQPPEDMKKKEHADRFMETEAEPELKVMSARSSGGAASSRNAPSPSPVVLPALEERERSPRPEAGISGEDRMERNDSESEMSVEEPVPVSKNPIDAWEGDYRVVMEKLLDDQVEAALVFALHWRQRSPGDPLALLALGEVLQRQGREREAARAYGALIDLFPSRADLRRLAGQRLEALGTLELAADTYAVAVEQRADHPSGHHLLAFTLLKQGQHAAAIEVVRKGLEQPFDRFEGAHRILKEDASLIVAAWKREQPDADVLTALKGLGVKPASKASLRFILNWETDANDVDFHIFDRKEGHAYYSAPHLSSGGDLYADITSGYGPECFTIHKPGAFPYRMQAHYYSRGPMGFGMGKLQIIEHDGAGRLHFDERPFVVMTDGAFVALGEVEKSVF